MLVNHNNVLQQNQFHICQTIQLELTDLPLVLTCQVMKSLYQQDLDSICAICNQQRTCQIHIYSIKKSQFNSEYNASST